MRAKGKPFLVGLPWKGSFLNIFCACGSHAAVSTKGIRPLIDSCVRMATFFQASLLGGLIFLDYSGNRVTLQLPELPKLDLYQTQKQRRNSL